MLGDGCSLERCRFGCRFAALSLSDRLTSKRPSNVVILLPDAYSGRPESPGTFGTILPRGFIEAMSRLPLISKREFWWHQFRFGQIYLFAEKNGEHLVLKRSWPLVTPTLPKMLVYDDPRRRSRLSERSEKVIIPESLAMKLFGEGSAGKPLLAGRNALVLVQLNLAVLC